MNTLDVHITVYLQTFIENNLVNSVNAFIGYLMHVTSDVQNKNLFYCL